MKGKAEDFLFFFVNDGRVWDHQTIISDRKPCGQLQWKTLDTTCVTALIDLFHSLTKADIRHSVVVCKHSFDDYKNRKFPKESRCFVSAVQFQLFSPNYSVPVCWFFVDKGSVFSKKCQNGGNCKLPRATLNSGWCPDLDLSPKQLKQKEVPFVAQSSVNIIIVSIFWFEVTFILPDVQEILTWAVSCALRLDVRLFRISSHILNELRWKLSNPTVQSLMIVMLCRIISVVEE